MNKRFPTFIFVLCLCFSLAYGQGEQKSNLHLRAEKVESTDYSKARTLYIQAFEDYVKKGQMLNGVACGVKAASLYYQHGNQYREAFSLLRQIDQTISASKNKPSEEASMRYHTSKERMLMYMQLKKGESAKEQLRNMESHAHSSQNDSIKNDYIYNRTIFYYNMGQVSQGNKSFKEMTEKLTSHKEYGKVESVYQRLIANARQNSNASMLAQSYSSYMVWKDSVSAIKHADEVSALKKQIAANEATIADKDSSLSTRQMVIVGLCILACILAAVLIAGAVVLMRFILTARRQKKTIIMLNESNALKTKFISNISVQMEPTLRKLDSHTPEVKALLDFSADVQRLSELENKPATEVEFEEMQLQQFGSLIEEIRKLVKSNVTLTSDVPATMAKIHQEYVDYILRYLLRNAAEHTPEGGTISLEFKKRGPHTFQFLVSNTGSFIDEEKREDVFKPFLEIRDLTEDDGLGLPICKQMALKMNGDLVIDPKFTKGTRFILDWHA